VTRPERGACRLGRGPLRAVPGLAIILPACSQGILGTDAFPKHELYGLTSQARRAAFSVTLNIAEGSAKRGDGEFRRYLDIAIGSITELQVALRLARDRGYLSNHDWDVLERLRNHAGALTWLLYKAVSKRKRQEP